MTDHEQSNLFEGSGLARHTDPRTSKEAARSVRVGPLQVAVLRVLRYAESKPPIGLTMIQVVAITGKPYESITPRFRPLAAKGLIYDTGERRENPSGKMAIVWNITNRGIKVLEKVLEEKHD